MWNKIGFWFWVGFMIPLQLILAALNIGDGKMGMLALNILTITLSIFNARFCRKSIKSREEFQRWLDGKE